MLQTHRRHRHHPAPPLPAPPGIPRVFRIDPKRPQPLGKGEFCWGGLKEDMSVPGSLGKQSCRVSAAISCPCTFPMPR